MIPELIESLIFLDDEKADVVCLQEVTFNSNNNLAKQINDMMQNKYTYIAADLAEKFIDRQGKLQTDGLVVLTNARITKQEILTLQKVSADERGRPDFHKRIVQAIGLSNGLKVANIHLASNQNSYLQLRETIRVLPKEFLLVGDFNMHKSKILKEKPYWKNNYSLSVEFEDYISLPKENCTFDYLLLPRSMRFLKIETVQNLSDHSAVVCVFE